MPINNRRLQRVHQIVTKWPIPDEAVRLHFETFRHEGDLPDDTGLAAAVCQMARWGNQDADAIRYGRLIDLLARATARQEGKDPPARKVRDCLFDEAVHGPDTVKRFARLALRVLVWRGGDVSDAQLGNEHGLPEFGTVGMHVLDYPRRLATAPYEEQGRRLFDRYDEIRRAIAENEEDSERFVGAFAAFVEDGELPGPGLLRDYVLATFEIEMLHAHRRGKDVAEVMALLDRAATLRGGKRDDAIATVQQLARVHGGHWSA